MSILLDAVTRAKQQQMDGSLDPVLTPRAVMPQQQPSAWWPKAVAAMVILVALAIGGGLAYLWQYFFVPSSNSDAAAVQTAEPKAVEAATPAVAEVDAGVRVAGRVALPIAKPLPQPEPAYTAARAASSAEIPSDAESPAVQPDHAQDALAAQEPIILGANANQRGMAVLDQLQQQATAPAQEQTPPVDTVTPEEQQKALVARFQAALSEVERRNAINKSLDEDLSPSPAAADNVADATGQNPQNPLSNSANNQSNSAGNQSTAVDYPSYGGLPAGLQLQVPEFNITAHMYATDPDKRWLSVDGHELRQGDKIKGKLTIIDIRPRDVVLDIQGTRFKVPAI